MICGLFVDTGLLFLIGLRLVGLPSGPTEPNVPFEDGLFPGILTLFWLELPELLILKALLLPILLLPLLKTSLGGGFMSIFCILAKLCLVDKDDADDENGPAESKAPDAPDTGVKVEFNADAEVGPVIGLPLLVMLMLTFTLRPLLLNW